MKESELGDILTFLRSAEQLKDTLRSSHTSTGRQESTAEHTWRLCLMIMLFEKQYPALDILRVMKIAIVHDLGEAISGDIPAVEQVEGINKSEQERKDLLFLLRPLPRHLQEEILCLWDEYENASSQEALLVKAFDKLETVLQHTQGRNPNDFNYEFNLTYGKKYTDFDELTSSTRALVDRDTARLAGGNKTT